MRVNGSGRLSSIAHPGRATGLSEELPALRYISIRTTDAMTSWIVSNRKLSEPPAVRKSSQVVKHRAYCADRECSGPSTAVACA
jgi:hypothetical protein